LEIGVAHSRSRALSTLTPESKNPVLWDAELVQQVDKLLKALELLLEQGEVETAETQYVEFLKDCQCDLPETLDQAIKEWQASKP
jgi:hypothetical protein